MPTPDSDLQTLVDTRTNLTKRLENNPIFQAIQHIDRAIAVLQQELPRPTTQVEVKSNVIYGVVSAEQREAIANAIIQYFMQNRNASATVKELCEGLQERGIPLPEYAVSCVGAILGKREMFMK